MTPLETLSLCGAWQLRQAGRADWLPATVPGSVHTDLLAAGRIPDPFVGDHEAHVAWVAESDWELARTFDAPAALRAQARVELVCDGLDTLAEVFLNGQRLGHADNMFRQWRWEVGGLLRAHENHLLIRFASPVAYCAAAQAARPLPGVAQALPGAPHLRKAPCHFGWDWGPQLPAIGIWKAIRLEGRSRPRLTDLQLRQAHAAGRVTVTAALTLDAVPRAPLRARLRITAPDGAVQVCESACAGTQATVALEIADPQLWWPNGFGAQPLYDVEAALLDDAGAPVESRRLTLGLRTLTLRQEPDAWGRSFEFVVNGRRLFVKGSNWIPADSFPARLTEAQLEELIRAAAATHQSMLRVWGGGLYEDDRFYALCDRYGILVWQDCLFACSVYPLDDAAFRANVRAEIDENVRRLRHHACLALWCGNNEMEWGWVDWGWRTQPALAPLQEAYASFFHDTLPAWIAAADPDTPYWPSSPSSNTPFDAPNGQQQGDAHYWEVWHGFKPFTAYRGQFPRFMSEFGFQALPPLETIKHYAQEADWNMTSYIMERHQKNASGNVLIIAQMLDSFRLPKDFPSLVYLSLVLQAEGIRYGVEHWRRQMQRVAGTLYWQLNDCWPVASWSSLDWFGRWKALHYAARRFYAPLLLSIEEGPATQRISLSSDLATLWQGEVRWSLERFDGTPIAQGRVAVAAAPDATTPVCTLELGDALAGAPAGATRRACVLVAELWQGTTRLALQTAYFAPTKHLLLDDPGLEAEVEAEGEELAITLRARRLARLVEIGLAGAEGVLSDNYFDLPAGRTQRVTVARPAGWSLAQARAALRLRSIIDTY